MSLLGGKSLSEGVCDCAEVSCVVGVEGRGVMWKECDQFGVLVGDDCSLVRGGVRGWEVSGRFWRLIGGVHLGGV